MLKKIVISPDNKAANSFIEDLAKQKADIKKKIEAKSAKRLATTATKS